MEVLAGVTIGLLLIILGPLILIFSLSWFATDEVANRIQEFTGLPSETRRRFLADYYERRLGLTGSIFQRTVAPFLRNVAKFLGKFTPSQALQDQGYQLLLAGQPLGLGAGEFIGLRLILLLSGIAISFLVLRSGVNNQSLLLAILTMITCILMPIVWLRSRIRKRQELLLKGLPDALDMLSVCTTAGLGFDQSMQRVSEYWQTPMGNELGRVITEMEMGLSRKEALRNMAYRADVAELSSFVSLIVQAEQLGMSISNTVSAMAEQMRIERRFRAQEKARKLPNKILFPLAFFIFPSMMVLLLGPSIPALIDLFQFIGGG
jgi:tight adherence protein C